jgi:hypothetical protein
MFEQMAMFRSGGRWVIRIPTAEGETLEFRCRSAQQARYFASVFELRPTWYPKPHRILSGESQGQGKGRPRQAVVAPAMVEQAAASVG